MNIAAAYLNFQLHVHFPYSATLNHIWYCFNKLCDAMCTGVQ
jgi:hypothetical protein